MKDSWLRRNGLILISGVVVGVAALVLTWAGNPKNMGFCIACFERDIAGALGFHSAAKVQYLRPEIVGIVLGSTIAALSFQEFKGRAGSSPACRFVVGLWVMIGALVFLGCPLRMVIRLGGGDLTAVAGLLGFLAGILVGIVFLKRGFSLGRAYPVKLGEGMMIPGVMALLLALLLAVPGLLKFSEEGPGSMHAFWGISLVAGLVVGALAQRSRLCMAGGLRDGFLLRDFTLLTGFLAILGDNDHRKSDTGQLQSLRAVAAHCPQPISLVLPGDGAGRLGLHIAGRLSAASIDPGRGGERRFSHSGIRHDCRRGNCP